MYIIPGRYHPSQWHVVELNPHTLCVMFVLSSPWFSWIDMCLCLFLPSVQIGEEMSQNSFIKQYLAKQQELLRQRLEREAREAAEADGETSGQPTAYWKHTHSIDMSNLLYNVFSVIFNMFNYPGSLSDLSLTHPIHWFIFSIWPIVLGTLNQGQLKCLTQVSYSSGLMALYSLVQLLHAYE